MLKKILNLIYTYFNNKELLTIFALLIKLSKKLGIK